VEGPEGRALLAVESLLLEERQQARHQIQFKVLLLRSLVEVQDLVVLAETVAVEVAVRVIEQRALGVQIDELRPALDRLPESGRVLERKALLAQRVAKTHPRALFPAAGPPVALVHQYQIVALEGVDGDGPVAHLVAQPGHFEDLDRLAGEQPVPILVEQFGVDARRLELAQVLLGETLVGRQQQDAVQFPASPVRLQRVLVLQNIGVHQQRLAATGGAPVGQLVELRPGFGGSSKGVIWSASGLSVL
jgi:hypothetical protein